MVIFSFAFLIHENTFILCEHGLQTHEQEYHIWHTLSIDGSFSFTKMDAQFLCYYCFLNKQLQHYCLLHNDCLQV